MSEMVQQKLKYHQFWLFVGWSLVCLIIYSSLATSGMPPVASMINDKVGHMIGYLVLMLWFLQIYQKKMSRWILAILLIALGVCLEFLQGLGAVRMFEVADMAANTSGVFLGWLLSLTGLDKTLAWFEQNVMHR